MSTIVGGVSIFAFKGNICNFFLCYFALSMEVIVKSSIFAEGFPSVRNFEIINEMFCHGIVCFSKL